MREILAIGRSAILSPLSPPVDSTLTVVYERREEVLLMRDVLMEVYGFGRRANRWPRIIGPDVIITC